MATIPSPLHVNQQTQFSLPRLRMVYNSYDRQTQSEQTLHSYQTMSFPNYQTCRSCRLLIIFIQVLISFSFNYSLQIAIYLNFLLLLRLGSIHHARLKLFGFHGCISLPHKFYVFELKSVGIYQLPQNLIHKQFHYKSRLQIEYHQHSHHSNSYSSNAKSEHLQHIQVYSKDISFVCRHRSISKNSLKIVYSQSKLELLILFGLKSHILYHRDKYYHLNRVHRNIFHIVIAWKSVVSNLIQLRLLGFENLYHRSQWYHRQQLKIFLSQNTHQIISILRAPSF